MQDFADWSIRLIQAGKLQDVPFGDSTWETAIYKRALAGPVKVGRNGIEGDEHTGHGPDPERALCCHPARHYLFWQAYLRTSIPLGSFGENLTLDGPAEEDVCIGDILRCGSVVMQISMPRMPCFKQARRLERPDFVKLIMQTGKLGFLTRILEPGSFQQGDRLELIERPHPDISITYVVGAHQSPDSESTSRLATLPALGNEWRQRFMRLRDM